MTLATILSFARAQAQTDSNGLTDAKGIIFANEALQDFHRRLVNGGVDASQTQEAYRDATASTGTYLYPTDMLFLKAIELNYANTTASDYRVAHQVDASNLAGNTSFSWLRANASTQDPQFDDRGDQFEVFPTFTAAHNLTQAIRIIYFLQPTQYTATTDTIAYPESLDTTILGWRIVANYLYSLGASPGGGNNLLTGDAFNLKYDERVKQYIATLGRGAQQPIQAQGIVMSGWEF